MNYSKIALAQLNERLEATQERALSTQRPILRDGDKEEFERLWRIIRAESHLPASFKREIWHNLTGLLAAWFRQDATPEDLQTLFILCVKTGRLDVEREKAQGTLNNAFDLCLDFYEERIRTELRQELEV